jgi:hypothetical protein
VRSRLALAVAGHVRNGCTLVEPTEVRGLREGRNEERPLAPLSRGQRAPSERPLKKVIAQARDSLHRGGNRAGQRGHAEGQWRCRCSPRDRCVSGPRGTVLLSPGRCQCGIQMSRVPLRSNLRLSISRRTRERMGNAGGRAAGRPLLRQESHHKRRSTGGSGKHCIQSWRRPYFPGATPPSGSR